MTGRVLDMTAGAEFEEVDADRVSYLSEHAWNRTSHAVAIAWVPGRSDLHQLAGPDWGHTNIRALRLLLLGRIRSALRIPLTRPRPLRFLRSRHHFCVAIILVIICAYVIDLGLRESLLL